MKVLFIALLVTVSLPAFAADKICFHQKDDNGSSGDRFNAEVEETKLVVKNLSNGSAAWDGTYKRKKSDDVVNGRDGKTYLDFTEGTSGNDGCSEVLVDEDLVKANGQGWIKFRCRGEGFGEDKYFCRKDKQ